MKLHTIDTGNFKLDGGAMFGVVPKSIWNGLNPADANNMCSWAMRCLLIEDGNKLILIDNGIGDKQDAKFFSHYYLHGDKSLEGSLKNKGFSMDDITDVFLTHLHFDHCGGSIKYNAEKNLLVPAFKNATYWSHADHWQWATKPNPREKASFLKDNILPIQESGQLKFITSKASEHHELEWLSGAEIHPNLDILVVRGHTDAMMLPKIKIGSRHLIFMADLLPSAGHIPLPYVMAYDTRPLITMKEKSAFLNYAQAEQLTLFFEHDPVHECGSLHATDKGIRLKDTFSLAEM